MPQKSPVGRYADRLWCRTADRALAGWRLLLPYFFSGNDHCRRLRLQRQINDKFLFIEQISQHARHCEPAHTLVWQSVLLMRKCCYLQHFWECGLPRRFALPVCGARQKLCLTKQACFLPTAAHAAPSLFPPPAALRLAARKDVEGRWLGL